MPGTNFRAECAASRIEQGKEKEKGKRNRRKIQYGVQRKYVRSGLCRKRISDKKAARSASLRQRRGIYKSADNCFLSCLHPNAIILLSPAPTGLLQCSSAGVILRTS